MANDLAALKAKMEAARDEYHDALRRAHPWQPGTVLRNARGEIADVTEVVVRHTMATALGRVRKKDGAPGAVERVLWPSDWTIVEPRS